MILTQLTLAGRECSIAEPCFKKLRLILAAYSRLADPACFDVDKVKAVESILLYLLDKPISIKHLKNGELAALLQALPDLCGLKPVAANSKTGETRWGDLYAYLSAYFGWSYDMIDHQMTLSRLEEYRDYMQKHPPTHELLAAFMGYEYQDKQSGNSFLAGIAAQVKSKQRLSS